MPRRKTVAPNGFLAALDLMHPYYRKHTIANTPSQQYQVANTPTKIQESPSYRTYTPFQQTCCEQDIADQTIYQKETIVQNCADITRLVIILKRILWGQKQRLQNRKEAAVPWSLFHL